MLHYIKLSVGGAVGDARKSKGITYDTAQGACGEVCPRVEFNLSLRCENPTELRLLVRRHHGREIISERRLSRS
jgi:hypothetical protein